MRIEKYKHIADVVIVQFDICNELYLIHFRINIKVNTIEGFVR